MGHGSDLSNWRTKECVSEAFPLSFSVGNQVGRWGSSDFGVVVIDNVSPSIRDA